MNSKISKLNLNSIGISVFLTAEVEAVYAFTYKSSAFNNIYSGWNQFDLEAEYARMGIPNEHWVPSNINKNYEVK